jgi:hypothetical protein
MTAIYLFAAGILALLAFAIHKIRRVHLKLYEIDGALKRQLEETFRQVEALHGLYLDLKFDHSLPTTRGWAGSPDFLLELARHVRSVKPQAAVECSSGVSTIVIARALQLNGAGHVYSLEDNPQFSAETREALARHDLTQWATVIDAPLIPHDLGGRRWMWYEESRLPAGLRPDLLVIDGPVMTEGAMTRYPAGPVHFPSLKNGATVFLDDANRADEKAILKHWRSEFPELSQHLVDCEKGLAVLRSEVSQRHLPSVTVVLEWDNARRSEVDRVRATVRALHDQLLVLGPALDKSHLLVLFNDASVQRALIEEILHTELADERVRSRSSAVAATGLTYYSLKNRGASLADTEIVAFMDSDVVPEPDWLPSILAPFRDSHVQVVCGNTYMTTDSVYARAFALFWFFQFRAADGALKSVDQFFANNVAFRRHILDAYPFPADPGFRGSCTDLCEMLRASGITVWQQPRARVQHPPPTGLWHFVCRAICEGHDSVVRLAEKGEEDQQSLKHIYWRFRSSLGNAFRRIRHYRQRVGMSHAGVPVAISIAALYYALVFAGEWVSVRHPAVIRRYFAI